MLFGARRAASWQVVKLALADGSRTTLTTEGGYAPQASPDGRSILFTRLEAPGVWSMPVEGGEPALLVPGVRAAATMNWRVTTTGIYFIGATDAQVVLRRAPLTGGAATDVAWLGNYSWPGMTITADGSRVIYARWDRRDANIIAMAPR